MESFDCLKIWKLPPINGSAIDRVKVVFGGEIFSSHSGVLKKGVAEPAAIFLAVFLMVFLCGIIGACESHLGNDWFF